MKQLRTVGTILTIIGILGLVLLYQSVANSQTVNQSFHRTVILTTVDSKEKVTSTLIRKSVLYYSDDHKLREKVIEQSGKLKGWRIPDDTWKRFCIEKGFRLDLPGVKWTCSTDIKAFRASEPVITEIEPYR